MKAVSSSRTTRQLPAHPLLWLPRQSLPTRKTGTLPPTLGNGLCRSNHSGYRTQGLPRPLRATDRRFPPAMPGLPPRSHDSHRTANRALHILNLEGYFMRPPDSQPLSLQLGQDKSEENCLGTPIPNTPSFFRSGSEPINPRSSVTRHSRITRHRRRTIPFARASSRFNTHSASDIEAV